MHRTRARSLIATDTGDIDKALHHIEEGIEEIETFFRSLRPGRPGQGKPGTESPEGHGRRDPKTAAPFRGRPVEGGIDGGRRERGVRKGRRNTRRTEEIRSALDRSPICFPGSDPPTVNSSSSCLVRSAWVFRWGWVKSASTTSSVDTYQMDAMSRGELEFSPRVARLPRGRLRRYPLLLVGTEDGCPVHGVDGRGVPWARTLR